MHRVSPLKNAIFYFVLGAVFVYFAFHSINDETVFNLWTIILVILATLSFGIGIRFFQFYFKLKNKSRKK